MIRLLIRRSILLLAAAAMLPAASSAHEGHDDPGYRVKVPPWWFEPGGMPSADPSQEPWMKDPFGHISEDMLSAATDLHQSRTKPPVEVSHPQVEQRLEKLIALLEKQCQGGGSGAGSGSPSRPATQSTLRTGPGREGPLRDPSDSTRKWAKLTPKQREKIQQARTEGFPPGYEDVLADYFLRLSREGSDGKPAESPQK